MIIDDCTKRREVLKELAERAPDAPFLALGQTVFWDEPMKAGLILESGKQGLRRKFLAGIHDTDYFAKFSHRGVSSGYRALPHNDTWTKGLWSAAGEFSALMGSETVVSKERMIAAGAKLAWIQKVRPEFLDQATEAWGWRGVVSLAPASQTTAEKPLHPLFRELYDTLSWAIEESLDLISGPHHRDSEKAAHHLLEMTCDAAENSDGTLADFYRSLAPKLYDWVAGEHLGLDTTTTTELLRFNRYTANSPRFDLPRLFVEPATRDAACNAYDAAVAGSEIYPLARFGIGAIPFDLLIPGIGRGTLRIGTRGLIVMTPTPVGVSFRKPVTTMQDLASVIEDRFGPDCVLVGKAVTLIGMLAREHIFVFHEGASGYVHLSKSMHDGLAAAGHRLQLNPILRIGYEPWDAMTDCCAWISLPQPLQGPFGVQELSAPSFSIRWRPVAEAQRQLLADLPQLRRPLDLIGYLRQTLGGPWQCLSEEYSGMQAQLEDLHREVAAVKAKKRAVYHEIRNLRQMRQDIEKAKGEHWRAHMFDKSPAEEDRKRREEFIAEHRQITGTITEKWREWRQLEKKIADIVSEPTIVRIRERRRDIALEAELTRIRLVREATIATSGLEKAAHRPSAWWFRLVCPDGTWFRATMATAIYRLEEIA